VKGDHHVFGSVSKRHDYPLLRPLCSRCQRCCSSFFSQRHKVCTASLQHYTEQDNYINKAPCFASLSSLFPASALLFVFLLPAAQGLHGFLTALHRAGRLHQQDTMFHSGASGSAAGYFLHHPLKFLIKTLLVSVIYMIYMMFLFTLNKRTIDVTNIMIMLFV
jgi:hypothetical protein